MGQLTKRTIDTLLMGIKSSLPRTRVAYAALLAHLTQPDFWAKNLTHKVCLTILPRPEKIVY